MQTFRENVQVKDMVDIFQNKDFQIFKDIGKSDLYVLEDPFSESNSPFNFTPRSDKSEILRKSTLIPKSNLPLSTPVQLPSKRPYSSSSNDIENKMKVLLRGENNTNLQLILDLAVTATTFKIDNFYEKDSSELMTKNSILYTYEFNFLRFLFL